MINPKMVRPILLLIVFFTVSKAQQNTEEPIPSDVQAACNTYCNSPNAAYLNSQVSNDISCHTQAEVAVEINPQNPNNLVAIWIDYRNMIPQIGFGYTADGGQTWNGGVLPSNIDGWTQAGD